MSQALLVFNWQGSTFRFSLDPIERGGRGPMAVLNIEPGVAGVRGVSSEVPLADLVVLGHAAQGALDARRAIKGLAT